MQINLAVASGKVNQSQLSGFATHGYDPVVYFEQGEAKPGEQYIVYEYQNVKWTFASEDNKALFSLAPERYIPQYGGYCS